MGEKRAECLPAELREVLGLFARLHMRALYIRQIYIGFMVSVTDHGLYMCPGHLYRFARETFSVDKSRI